MAQQFPYSLSLQLWPNNFHVKQMVSVWHARLILEKEKLQCVKYVTLWHLPCLFMDMPTTLDDTMNWICYDCLNMERSFVPVTHQVHNNVSADPMDAMLVLERGNNTNIADSNMSLSNTLTGDLQCFSCFGLYERLVTVSSSTLYLKNMSFFQSIYYSPSLILLCKIFGFLFI